MTRIRGVLLLLVLVAGLAADSPAAPLNLNTASVEQLESLPGLGASRARMVVRMRERNGPFRSVHELLILPRLTRAQFESLRKRLYVESARAGERSARARTRP